MLESAQRGAGTSPEGRVADLSLDEKATLTAGVDAWHTAGIPRVGLAALRLTDGPSGARGHRSTGTTSTLLPCSTALAAAWDRELTQRAGRLLGDEARAKGAHVLLAPTVNIHRHPLTGRHFECFSEDPYVSAELAVAYIRGVQERGVGCAVKHLVANDQEHDRMQVSVEVDERALREIYLPPFEAAVVQGGAWAVMAAYNRLRGVHCSEHPGLLRDILRGEWGFDGLVVSDWSGTHSTAALAAGLDLEMPGPARHLGAHAAEAVRRGDFEPSHLDRAAECLVALAARTTQPAPPPRADLEPGELAREIAAAGIVLLRNDGILPLEPARLGSVAVVGPQAARPAVQGGGSAHVDPPGVVTPLDGLQRRMTPADGPGAERPVSVVHEPGVPRRALAVLGPAELRVPGGTERGWLVEYFAGPEGPLTATPVGQEVVPRTGMFWLDPPVAGLPPEGFSVRARAEFVPPRGGTWHLSLANAGRARARLDGEVVLDNMSPRRDGPTEVTAEVELEADRPYELVVELFVKGRGPETGTGILLTAQEPEDPDALPRAVAVAAASDVAVVLVGDETPIAEGADRTTLDLPDDQVALIEQVAAANPRTVVVLNTGAPVTMPWLDEVAAVVQLWYPGQEAGRALAEVLCGDRDATGRLPTTFPRSLADTPAHAFYPGADHVVRYGEGLSVGYRHYDSHDVEPLFCFGHGLSYTQFTYAGLRVERNDDPEVADPSVLDAGPRVVVTVDVTNVGDRSGREVAQLYVHPVEGRGPRAARELRQFRAVDLAPGETTSVVLGLPARAFAHWDPDGQMWRVTPGEYEIEVGSSSRDIRQRALVTLG